MPRRRYSLPLAATGLGVGPRQFEWPTRGQGAVSAIFYNAEEDLLEAAEDRRRTSAAMGF